MIEWDKYSELLDSLYATAGAEQISRILELKSDLVGANLELVEAKKRILDLETQLGRQSSATDGGAGVPDHRDELEFERGVYWRTKPGSDKRDGPFCQKCWDVSAKQVRLQRETTTRHGFGTEVRGWMCLNCSSFYRDAK